jgi:hypothetical protein
MHNDNIRLYTLARELNVESEQLLRLCRQAGIEVKNHLSRPARQAAAQAGSAPAAGLTPAPQSATPGAVQATTAPAAVNKVPTLQNRMIRDLKQPRSGSTPRPKAPRHLPRPALVRRAAASPWARHRLRLPS